MFWVNPIRSPARLPALFFPVMLFVLQGCSLLPTSEPEPKGAPPVQGAMREGQSEAFTVEVKAPDAVREYLERNLEIQRYRKIADLEASEVSRLMVAAEANARELLATLGYFAPRLTLELKDTPDSNRAPRQVDISVEPGERTRVQQVAIDFGGPAQADPAAEPQRRAIRSNWTLPPGEAFSQERWDQAKAAGLRTLAARRYPTGRVSDSRADIYADRQAAHLAVTYASGPAYRFGPLLIRGSERYDPDGARRIAQLPTGAVYDQQQLLDTQQRLASSGYYDSVFLALDTDGDPQWAPVTAQVLEAPLQKVVFGVGFTTDGGPRVSLDHAHNRMPLLGWRAVSKISIDRETKSIGTDWTAIPGDDGWRWVGSGLLKREISGTNDVDSARLRGGRSKASGRIERSYYLQYDLARYQGPAAPPSASAMSAHWTWTGRYFDNLAAPRRGNGLALELGAGYTLTGERAPFLRSYARWLGIIPLGADAGRGHQRSPPQPAAAARRGRYRQRPRQCPDSGHPALPDRRRHHGAWL